jgi:apolipoprotein N-acyltransferase
LPLGSEGVLDAPLPKAMSATPYARFGDMPAMLMVAIAFVIALRRRTRNISAK